MSTIKYAIISHFYTTLNIIDSAWNHGTEVVKHTLELRLEQKSKSCKEPNNIHTYRVFQRFHRETFKKCLCDATGNNVYWIPKLYQRRHFGFIILLTLLRGQTIFYIGPQKLRILWQKEGPVGTAELMTGKKSHVIKKIREIGDLITD